MKVTNSEISKGSPSKRSMRKMGLKGGVITFKSESTVFEKTVVELNVNGDRKFYQVEEVSTIDKHTVECAAVEYGYWKSKLSISHDFDVRTLLDKDVIIVTDEKQLAHLKETSCYC